MINNTHNVRKMHMITLFPQPTKQTLQFGGSLNCRHTNNAMQCQSCVRKDDLITGNFTVY